MKIVDTRSISPKGMKDLYYDMFVTVGSDSDDADMSFVFDGIDGLQLRSYLMAAYWPKDKEKKAALKKSNKSADVKRQNAISHHRKEHLIPKSALRRAWEKSIGEKDKDTRDAVRWAYNGKGRPEDYEWALTIAAETGQCGASKAELQVYCDKHLGIDCSGFVNAYFQTKGKLSGRDYYTISRYSRFPSRDTLREVAQDDCLIWTDQNGKVKTGPGHIMLVHERTGGADKEGKDDILTVVESCGGKGLVESPYKRLKDKTVGRGSKKETLFLMDRGVPGKSNMWVKIVKPF